MRTTALLLLIGPALLLPVARAAALEALSFEEASEALQASTVTIRIIPGAVAQEEAVGQEEEGQFADDDEAVEMPRRVTVSSGASLGDGLVVTYANMSSNDEVRITIPGGEQAKAQLRVVDHISGLTLLEIDRKDVPGLKTAAEDPKVGQWVLAAAAWGAEKPVVSFGILSGMNRTIRGATFPPLLQCDLRTAETSSGSALVNQRGELIGVVVATDVGRDARWSYAVPARHVQRLVRARHPNKVIEIQRRRPVVGLKLVPGDTPGTVFVQRVEKNGPADKAGIAEGDQVVAAEGVKIRSVYEVIRPLLAKQPGDTMNFAVQSESGTRKVDVVLGGGTIMPETPRVAVTSNVAPRQIVIEQVGFNRFDVRNKQPQPAPLAPGGVTSAQIDLLQKAVERYGTAVETLKSELDRRDQELAERDAVIRTLKAQLEAAQSPAP